MMGGQSHLVTNGELILPHLGQAQPEGWFTFLVFSIRSK